MEHAMNHCLHCEIFCIRFDFGLPLEDINPPNDVHRKLKNLLNETYLAVAGSQYDLHKVLKCQLQQGIISEGLLLKKLFFTDTTYNDAVFFSKSDTNNPGAFLWLLRHFLGLLPLPLFPGFADNTRLNFDWLALLCRMKKRASVRFINLEIAKTLRKLPRANLIMIEFLLGCFRRITGCHSRHLERKYTLAMVKYFSSALFVRPYTPGCDTLQDTLYYPLTYHLIKNWLDIKQIGPFNIEIIRDVNNFEDYNVENTYFGIREYEHNNFNHVESRVELVNQQITFNKKKEEIVEANEEIKKDTVEKTSDTKLIFNTENEDRASLKGEDFLNCTGKKATPRFPKKSLSHVLTATQKYFFHGKLMSNSDGSEELKKIKSEGSLRRSSRFSLKNITSPIKLSSLKYRKLLTI